MWTTKLCTYHQLILLCPWVLYWIPLLCLWYKRLISSLCVTMHAASRWLIPSSTWNWEIRLQPKWITTNFDHSVSGPEIAAAPAWFMWKNAAKESFDWMTSSNVLRRSWRRAGQTCVLRTFKWSSEDRAFVHTHTTYPCANTPAQGRMGGTVAVLKSKIS